MLVGQLKDFLNRFHDDKEVGVTTATHEQGTEVTMAIIGADGKTYTFGDDVPREAA